MAARWLWQLDQRTLPPLARTMMRVGGGRARSRALAGTGFVVVLTIMIGSVWLVSRQRATAGTADPATVVGVRAGQSLSDYAEESRARLANLLASTSTATTEVYGLVTFKAYLAPDRLTPVVGGVAAARVAMRVPLPGTATEPVQMPAYRVPVDVTAAMDAVAERKAGAAAAAQRRYETTGDDTVEHRQLRVRYRSEALTASAEATAFRQYCSCVYAAVVQATPVALEEIAHRPEVWVVDPAPRLRWLSRATFAPPLPEQVDRSAVPGTAVLGLTPSAGPADKPGPSGSSPPSGVHTIPVQPNPTCTTSPSPSLRRSQWRR